MNFAFVILDMMVVESGNAQLYPKTGHLNSSLVNCLDQK